MQEKREPELIDYLRVLWWGKWIVLACVVAAATTAAVFMLARKPTYSATGVYEVRETLSLYAPTQNSATVAGQTLPTQSAATLAQLAVRTLPSLDAVGIRRSVSQRDSTLIDVTVSGTAFPRAIESALTASTSALEAGLLAGVEQELTRERVQADIEQSRLTRQVTMLRTQMAEETSVPVLEAFAEKVATLEMLLAEASVWRDGLSVLVPKELVSLREITHPSIVEPSQNTKTTLIVAGFLGLCVGVMLAFFTHYLTRDARRAKAARSGPSGP